MDAIDSLARLAKSGDDDEAYMLGYRDARAGKPAKPKQAAAPDDDDAPQGVDVDGDGDSDVPSADTDGDGDTDGVEAAEDDDEGDEVPGDEGDEDAQATGEDPELPADDGENYGVGDLNEDGETTSLIEEVAAVEKDYYAAAGLHGVGHHKTQRALDVYHRVVRKLVRALMGEPNDDAQSSDGQPPEKAGKPGKPGKGPPPAQGSEGDDEGGGDEGDEAPQAKGPGDEGDDEDKGPPLAQGDDEEDKPKKKGKPMFGKSLDGLGAIALESGDPDMLRDLVHDLVKGGGHKYTKRTPKAGGGYNYEYPDDHKQMSLFGDGDKHLGKTSNGKPIPHVPERLGHLDKVASEAVHKHGLFSPEASPSVRASQEAQREHFDSYTEGWSAQDHKDAENAIRDYKRSDHARASGMTQNHEYAHNGLSQAHSKAAEEIEKQDRAKRDSERRAHEEETSRQHVQKILRDEEVRKLSTKGKGVARMATKLMDAGKTPRDFGMSHRNWSDVPKADIKEAHDEHTRKSYRDMVTDPLAKGAEGLRTLPSGPAPVQLIDDRVDPSVLFRKSQGRRYAADGRSAPIVVTVDARCPLHGHDHESIYKSQVLATPHLHCTCKR